MGRRRLLPILISLLLTSACGTAETGPAAPQDNRTLSVSTAFYPIEYLVTRIGGRDVKVTNLTSPGTEPHDLELTPRQVAKLTEDDLVVYLSGFQPAVDEAVAAEAQQAGFDLAEVTQLLDGYTPLEDGELHSDDAGADPHVWLDPMRYAELGDAVAGRLAELAPERATSFSAAARSLRTELEGLDEQYRQGLSQCARKDIVTSHNAFGYLAQAYDLEQVAITGLTPGSQAGSGRLAEVATLARQRGVTTIFFEDLVSPAVAESLAREVGARAVELSPLEGRPGTGDYFTVMRANLDALRTALGCS